MRCPFVMDHSVLTIYFRYQSSTGVLGKTRDRVHYRCLSLIVHLPHNNQCLKPAMSVSWQTVMFHLENRKSLLAAKLFQ